MQSGDIRAYANTLNRYSVKKLIPCQRFISLNHADAANSRNTPDSIAGPFGPISISTIEQPSPEINPEIMGNRLIAKLVWLSQTAGGCGPGAGRRSAGELERHRCFHLDNSN